MTPAALTPAVLTPTALTPSSVQNQPPVAPRPGHTATPVPAHSLPVLPGTLLGLELLAQRPALDLRAAARLLRDDPGAVLALFSAIREEGADAGDRPLRLEECCAHLSRHRLLQALAETRIGSRPAPPYVAFVQHAVTVGRHAEAVAGTLGLPQETARLAGLLHELGRTPGLLGWSGWPHDATDCCHHLARAHALPTPLGQALGEIHGAQPGSAWVAVIAAAHELLPASLTKR